MKIRFIMDDEGIKDSLYQEHLSTRDICDLLNRLDKILLETLLYRIEAENLL